MAARKNKFDEKLARLQELENAPEGQAVAELRKVLGEQNAFFIAEAARLAKTLELRQLEKDLVQACWKLLRKEIEDLGCRAKRLVLETLVTFEAYVPELYVLGSKHVQIEYGDTAGGVRCICAYALAKIDYRDAVLDIAPMLFDALPEVRAAAAEALTSTADKNAAAILHVRLLGGGEGDGSVLEAMYRGLLILEPRRYLPVVGEALKEGDQAAALALGESRLPEAFSVLKDALRTANGGVESTILLSIGLLRMEEATGYLHELVDDASEHRAAKAIEALALHKHDTRVADRVSASVKKRKSKKLAAVFSEKFGGDV